MSIIRNGGFDMSSMQIHIDCENAVEIERYAQIVYKNIGSRWTASILYYLSENGAMRFGELRKVMPSISHKILRQKLRELERKILVKRKDYNENPPKVEYFLTNKGDSVVPLIRAIGKELDINEYDDYNKFLSDSECPLERAFKVFSGKWKTSILFILYLNEGIRYSQIKSMLDGITDKYLATQLKALENDELISRIAYLEIPPRTEYYLNEKGKELLSTIEKIISIVKEKMNGT